MCSISLWKYLWITYMTVHWHKITSWLFFTFAPKVNWNGVFSHRIFKKWVSLDFFFFFLKLLVISFISWVAKYYILPLFMGYRFSKSEKRFLIKWVVDSSDLYDRSAFFTVLISSFWSFAAAASEICKKKQTDSRRRRTCEQRKDSKAALHGGLWRCIYLLCDLN